MPISVTCAACSSSFKVKDEYAGKRAKCPKCAAPITIPAMVDTVLMPPPAKAAAPVAARPVVSSKPTPKPAPQPVDDEADEPVRPKRRRGADDEDDAPVNPKRKRGADSDDNEAPKSRRRRRDDDDDDEPKKKSKALPIILGIVGGVLLLCGGGCAGVWFWLKGQAEQVASQTTSIFQPSFPTSVGSGPADQDFEDKLRQIKPKMKLRDVRALLGPEGRGGGPVELSPKLIAESTGDPSAWDRWRPKVSSSRVARWDNKLNVIWVCFTQPPEPEGLVEVVGVLARIGGSTSEPVRLDATAVPLPPNPPKGTAPTKSGGPNTGSKPSSESAISIDTLFKDAAKLRGEVVVITGKVGRIEDVFNPPSLLFSGPDNLEVSCSTTPKGWGNLPKVGDTVTIRGQLYVVETGVKKSYLMGGCELLPGKPDGR